VRGTQGPQRPQQPVCLLDVPTHRKLTAPQTPQTRDMSLFTWKAASFFLFPFLRQGLAMLASNPQPSCLCLPS
jgi:hypothetical protein